jgi:hypothetical protein
MNPKEKAKELYDKMLQWQTDGNIYIQRNITSTSAKHSALISVEEMLKHMSFHFGQIGLSTLEYWNQVKHEIEKL